MMNITQIYGDDTANIIRLPNGHYRIVVEHILRYKEQCSVSKDDVDSVISRMSECDVTEKDYFDKFSQSSPFRALICENRDRLKKVRMAA